MVSSATFKEAKETITQQPNGALKPRHHIAKQYDKKSIKTATYDGTYGQYYL